MTRERGKILENDTELLSLYSTSKLTLLCGSAKCWLGKKDSIAVLRGDI
jgi:hypothetical protein